VRRDLDTAPLEEGGPQAQGGRRVESPDPHELEGAEEPLPLQGGRDVSWRRAGQDHGVAPRLDVGAQDGDHGALGDALQPVGVLEVVEEQDGVDTPPRQREGERQGGHERGEPVAALGVLPMRLEQFAAGCHARVRKALAQPLRVETRRGRLPEEDDQLPEALLQEVAGQGERMRKDLAERKVEGERTGLGRPLRQRQKFRLEFEQKRRLADVGRAEDEDGGTRARTSLQAHPQQGGPFLVPPEELLLAERELHPLIPQKAHRLFAAPPGPSPINLT